MDIELLNEVESIVTQRDIAQLEQFLLLPQCFKKLCGKRLSKKMAGQKNDKGGKIKIMHARLIVLLHCISDVSHKLSKYHV